MDFTNENKEMIIKHTIFFFACYGVYSLIKDIFKPKIINIDSNPDSNPGSNPDSNPDSGSDPGSDPGSGSDSLIIIDDSELELYSEIKNDSIIKKRRRINEN